MFVCVTRCDHYASYFLLSRRPTFLLGFPDEFGDPGANRQSQHIRDFVHGFDVQALDASSGS